MNCLYCYKELTPGMHDFHPACSRKIFGKPEPPILPYTEEQMMELAKTVIRSHVAVTGVQAKLSVEIENAAKGTNSGALAHPARFTIVGLWGSYILKPPTRQFMSLPEVEDLTMHLAEIANIQTVPHSLIRLQSGNLAYITKRIDQVKRAKLHMEDMCQLTERLTEDKYKGSYEQISKAVLKYSSNPGLDLINFYEQVLFSFLTGNADMHLKNFSMINRQGMGYELAPAYDMVTTALLMKNDNEDLALTLNGKKRKLIRKDFDALMSSIPMVDNRSIDGIYRKFTIAIPKWLAYIDSGFISDDFKNEYKEIIKERALRLSLT